MPENIFLMDIYTPDIQAGMAGNWGWGAAALITSFAIICFVALYALIGVYAERKISAFIQDRLGPMETGPWGFFQTFADIFKLILKENIVPKAADYFLFTLAPILVFVSILAGFAALPFGPDFQGASLNVGVLFVIAVVSIEIVGLLMAGWGSNNKYSLLGAVRSVAQIISYEIPAALAILAAIMMYGTLEMNQISFFQGVHSHERSYFLGIWDVSGIGGFFSWGIFRYPHLLVGFIVYFIASLAECNRAPFDIPEAESELVAGFHIEYTGFKFAVLMLAEYANMFLVAMIAAVLFLGGWNTPLPNLGVLEPSLNPLELSHWELLRHKQLAYFTSGQPGTTAGILWGLAWILIKACGIVIVQMWVRWTFPRVRVDQLMYICWKVLTPAGIGLVVISGIWKLLEVYSGI